MSNAQLKENCRSMGQLRGVKGVLSMALAAVKRARFRATLMPMLTWAVVSFALHALIAKWKDSMLDFSSIPMYAFLPFSTAFSNQQLSK